MQKKLVFNYDKNIVQKSMNTHIYEDIKNEWIFFLKNWYLVIQEEIDKIELTLKKRKSKFWIDLFRRSNIPCSTIDNIKKVVKNPQLIKRNMIQDYIEYSSHKIKDYGNNINFNNKKKYKIKKKKKKNNK